jgi:hypothetical protein
MSALRHPGKQASVKKNPVIQLRHLMGAMLLFTTAGSVAHGLEPPAGGQVSVFILSGQSNMVGAGKVDGGSSRWGSQFLEPVVSVYEGTYDSKTDYDAMKPVKTLELEEFGGVQPTPYPGGGVQVTRGFVQAKETGLYEFRPGYGGSMNNMMEVNGKEVHRKEVGKDAIRAEIKLEAGKQVPFKITYFTKDANGLGWIVRVDVPGTLSTLVKQKEMYPYLMNDIGQWVARDDVWYKGVVTATGSRWLGVSGGSIGPELGFGHVIGNHYDEPVLILKTSQGNRSLSWDFLPPGSKRFEHGGEIYAAYKESPLSWKKGTEPKPINWYAGKQYDDCFGAAHEVLDNFDKQFPHWKGRGYKIEGFAWWQGDKDRYNEGHSLQYEKNLVHLIKSLRREFEAPDAKFVVATLGQTAKENAEGNEKLILDAQLAVDGHSGRFPEFKGNVATVYTNPLSQGGASNSHYNGNAQTYMDVGLGMGKAMVELLGNDGPKTKYVNRAVLSPEQETIVLELAAKRGIRSVAEISTHNIYPSAARGIVVKGEDQIEGRLVSTQILNIRFKDWWHPGQGPREGDIRIGDFWAGKPFTRKQTILKVAGKQYRTGSVNGLSAEESESVLGQLLNGKYSVGDGVRKESLVQIDWSKPQFIRKRGNIVSVGFLHKGGSGSGFFDLEIKANGKELTIQQLLQAVP